MKTIRLIFTRDYDQWLNEMIRNSLVRDCPKIWGLGLTDQITYFNGKTFAWYRYATDMEKLKSFLVSRPLNAEIFSARERKRFFTNIQHLRDLIQISPKSIRNPSGHLRTLTRLFKDIYPYYPLGIFIAGPWRDDFMRVHGPAGKPTLKHLYAMREQSEGVLKLIGLFLREWVGPKMKAAGYPAEFFRLLTVAEVQTFVNHARLPRKTDLIRRNKGYICQAGKIYPVKNFFTFLKQHGLQAENPDAKNRNNTIRGTVAHPGRNITGKVQLIFNSYDVRKFKPGSILVTPMTSPEYLLAMRTAKAIITDEGGLTCHAAITAREIKKPTIIGTRVASKCLKNNQKIALDAKNGVITT